MPCRLILSDGVVLVWRNLGSLVLGLVLVCGAFLSRETQATDRLAELAEAELVSNAPEVGGRLPSASKRSGCEPISSYSKPSLRRALADQDTLPLRRHSSATPSQSCSISWPAGEWLTKPPCWVGLHPPKDTWVDFSAEDRQEFSMEMVVSALPAFTRRSSSTGAGRRVAGRL